jgi:hypothetical protein
LGYWGRSSGSALQQHELTHEILTCDFGKGLGRE